MPETTRIARVLDIIWRISTAPNYWTRKRLAEQLEVSERSITGDLEIIRHKLRFEVKSDRGRGYYFDRIPSLPSVSYSIPEALALILAAQVGRQFAGIPQHDLSSAVARLSSAIPEELRSMVEELSIAGEGYRDTHRESILQLCSRAIAARRSMSIVYSAASHDGQETSRRIDPYAVFPYVRSWHVVGYCHLREDVRIFKIDRVHRAKVLDIPWEPREEFDLAAYLSSGWGIIRGIDAPVEDVVLRFLPPSSRWVAEERWHGSQRVRPNDDGSMLFQVRIQVTPEFQRWVFRYGRDVEVLEPEHLRIWMQEEARAVIAGAALSPVAELDA
ncbi:MAG TPA: WYL domain-containing protein [Thermomicrobiales bacterium]|nr:WYL domain-containing protein [Thermomicrobiales bacterium]